MSVDHDGRYDTRSTTLLTAVSFPKAGGDERTSAGGIVLLLLLFLIILVVLVVDFTVL